ncbi:MAG: MotE family protein [Bdellovibrionales bacterium]
MKKNGYDQFFSRARENQRQRTTADPESRLRTAVKAKRPPPPFPWRAVAGLVASLGLAGSYLLAPEFFESLAERVEISAIGQAGAADGPAAEKAGAGGEKAEKDAAHDKSSGSAKGPDADGAVSEDLSHFQKLKQRKEELDMREKELTQLEEELQRQKVELDRRIQQLEEMRSQIAQTLQTRVEVDQEKVNKLVDLYSNMKPKQAADVIGSINEDLAVEVLAKMKKKNAAEIMNLLPPEKARVLSEKYTGYRRGRPEPKG